MKRIRLPFLLMTAALSLCLFVSGCSEKSASNEGPSSSPAQTQSSTPLGDASPETGGEMTDSQNSDSSAMPAADTASNKPDDTPAHPADSTDKDFEALGFELQDSEAIGKIMLDMTETDVINALGQPDYQSEPEVWGADGSEHSQWTYADAGLYLDMTRDSADEGFAVFSITAADACPFETRRGIKLGDTKDDVLTAYGDAYNEMFSTDDMLIFGSIYGGLAITFENGVVSGFFLGAMAE